MKNKKLLMMLFFSFLLLGLAGCKNGFVITHRTIIDGPDNYHFADHEINITDSHAEIDYSKFTGVKTLWELETENTYRLSLKYSSYNKKGKIKIVLITPEEEIINVFEEANNGHYDVELSNGKYQLKIVGFDANGYLEVDLSTESNIKFINKEEL